MLFAPSVPPLLLAIAPSVMVFKVNELVFPTPAVPPVNVKTSLNVVPEPVSTEIEFPAVPAEEAVNWIAVVASVASTPILAPSILATKLSIYPAVLDPVAKKNTGLLSTGKPPTGSAAINLNSFDPTVIWNSSSTVWPKSPAIVNEPLALLAPVIFGP